MDFQTTPVVRSEIPGGFKLAFHGAIHTNTAWIERELDAVVQEKPKRVELDFHDTEHISSLGMGVLIGFNKKIDALGGTVVITALRKRTYAAFCAVRMNETFKIDPAVVIDQ